MAAALCCRSQQTVMRSAGGRDHLHVQPIKDRRMKSRFFNMPSRPQATCTRSWNGYVGKFAMTSEKPLILSLRFLFVSAPNEERIHT
jgi:hypothetical protein